MIYNWFLIFNLTSFEALGLTSKQYVLNLDGVGEKTILVTKGETIGMLYDGVFLSLKLYDENPFEFDSHAIFIDDLTNDVYLGIPT